MDTDRIVESYFETLFPNRETRIDNLAKLGHFVKTPETLLVIHGARSTGKKTLFSVLTLLGGPIKRITPSLFMGDTLFEWNGKLIALTPSLHLLRPFPNLKPIMVHCERHLNQTPNSLPIVIYRNLITNSVSRLLARYEMLFERYDMIPEYNMGWQIPKNTVDKYRNLYRRLIS